MCVCVDVCFSRGVVHVSVIDDVLAMASILSSVCVCVWVVCASMDLQTLEVWVMCAEDYWFVVEFGMLQSYLITSKTGRV